MQNLDEISLNSHERDQHFYDMGEEMVPYNDDSTPTEELPQVSQDDDDDADDAKYPIFSFRHTKSYSISGASSIPQERPTSGKFYRTSSASGLYSKPAYSPIINAHVAGSPIRFGFCTTPVDNNESEEQLVELSQLPRSQAASSTSSNSAYATPYDDKVTASSGDRSEIALEAVRRKLSTMSRTRKAGAKRSERRSPEPSSSPDEALAVPPDIIATSDTLRKDRGRCSAKHSRSGSSSPATSPGVIGRTLKHAGLSIPMSASTIYDRSIPSHKDSLELVRHRMGEDWPTVDPQLSCTRDSIVLAKQRWERYPRSHAVIDEQSGQIKYAGLSTIMDASPPDHKTYLAARREQLAKQKEVEWQREIGGHPENDHECPICE
ncbi:hypothetical protein KCU86_g20572, partial [Aureobasidium melanogenum]